MFSKSHKAEKYTVLRKILAHIEFDGSNRAVIVTVWPFFF